MGWTITTYALRAVMLVSLPIMLVILFHLIKGELSAYKKEKTCLFCERVSVEAWACHNDREHCINCCYCPDHIDTTHKHLTCSTAPANTWCGNCAEVN